MKCFFRFNIALVLIFLVCIVFSCSKEVDDVDIELEKSPDPDKTVLIYIAASNNLAPYAKDNLCALKGGYVPDYFEEGGIGGVLLVYYHILGEPARLLRISKDSHGVVKEEVIQEYDERKNSANVANLREVLEYTASEFPSEDNGLFLWSHGTGWLPKDFYSNPVKSFVGSDGQLRQMSLPTVNDPMAHLVKSFGEDRGREMDIRDLADALPIKYSYIVFDACLMGGIEVAYELKDKADYIISSSAEVLAFSFPYPKIMTHIFENEESNLAKVCQEYVDFYSSQPSQLDRSATISLVKTSNLEELAAATAVIFRKERENLKAVNISQVQRYFRNSKSWFYDLDDYIKNIGSDANDYNRFSVAMEDAVIYKGTTSHFFFNGSSYDGGGFSIDRFSGLSTYVLSEENLYIDNYYKTLSWNIDVQMIK